MERQWRVVAGMGPLLYLGLDLTPLPGVFEVMGVKKRNRRYVLAKLQDMEREALIVLNDRE